MYRVVLADKIELRAEARLAACAELVRPDESGGLVAAISNADAIIVRTSSLTSETLSHAMRLRVIGKHGVGLDNIDVRYATAHGIAVVSTPAANATGVAEFTLACILLLQRPIVAAERALRAGRFTSGTNFVEQTHRLGLVGREIAGQTVGIVGWGAIGRRVGQAVSFLGACVVVFDPFVGPDSLGVSSATAVDSLDELLAAADVVTLHIPSTPETIGLVGARELALMRPEAVLVNTSRGAIVDEEALAEALRAGTIRAAAIDVFEQEPPPIDHPLLSLDNVICTPHLGGATVESLARMAEDVVDGVLSILNGNVPPGLANPEALPGGGDGT